MGFFPLGQLLMKTCAGKICVILIKNSPVAASPTAIRHPPVHRATYVIKLMDGGEAGVGKSTFILFKWWVAFWFLVIGLVAGAAFACEPEPTDRPPVTEGPAGFSSLYARVYDLGNDKVRVWYYRILNEMDAKDDYYETEKKPAFVVTKVKHESIQECVEPVQMSTLASPR